MEGFSVNILEAVFLGASIALSSLCCYLCKKSMAIADNLDNAPRFTIDEKLKDILKVTPGACLEYVVIEDAVKPAGKPLISLYKPKFVGAVRNFTLKEHSLLWNGFSRSWTDDEQVLHQRIDVVPFSLMGSDKTAVTVLCPLEACGLNLEITHEKFHQVNHSLVDLVGQYFSGAKPKGHLEIKEMLRVGTTLTGVSELILGTDGILSLQPPSNSSQYFLSMKEFGTLRGDNANEAFRWKGLAITFALAGAAVFFWVGLRYFRYLKVSWEQKQERREFNRLVTEASQQANVVGPENPEDRADMCVICVSGPRNCILLDCGHICCCFTCYQALPKYICPICRQTIVRVLPFYQA